MSLSDVNDGGPLTETAINAVSWLPPSSIRPERLSTTLHESSPAYAFCSWATFPCW